MRSCLTPLDKFRFLGSTLGVTDDGTTIALIRFKDEAAARANSDRPDQSVWWEQTANYYDLEPTIRESSDIETVFDGGSDAAGFVQIIEGKVNDRARMAELTTPELMEQLRAARPDIIGGIRVWFPDGAFVEAAYFTGESDAREGESSSEFADAHDEIASLYLVATFIDLHEPTFIAPERSTSSTSAARWQMRRTVFGSPARTPSATRASTGRTSRPVGSRRAMAQDHRGESGWWPRVGELAEGSAVAGIGHRPRLRVSLPERRYFKCCVLGWVPMSSGRGGLTCHSRGFAPWSGTRSSSELRISTPWSTAELSCCSATSPCDCQLVPQVSARGPAPWVRRAPRSRGWWARRSRGSGTG